MVDRKEQTPRLAHRPHLNSPSRTAMPPGRECQRCASITSSYQFIAVARALALFGGAFSLLNVLGQLRYPGFDANYWWINLRPIEISVARPLLAIAAVLLVAYALRPRMSKLRQIYTLVLAALLLLSGAHNMVTFYTLLAYGKIHAAFPVAFSLFVVTGLIIIQAAVLQSRPNHLATNHLRLRIILVVTVMVCLVGFPLAQIFCFGKTDYRRQADAIVVFGARVYADGRLSDALADRVRTGCKLYLDGLADQMIFSGGPGDGHIHETEAMRKMAVGLGVPYHAIVLDRNGLNTQATVNNTSKIFERLAAERVLAVSHFYHLPRIKMSYQRRRWQVYTVPAKETYLLTEMPKYILREVAALWVYYLRPLLS
jgi:vancomycin permeability regulator SanA